MSSGSPTALNLVRADTLHCAPFTRNSTLLRCSPRCTAGDILLCQPAGTDAYGQLLNCISEAELAQAWRDFLHGVWRVLGAPWGPLNAFTKTHPLLTGIPLLALGALDLLALAYCAAVLLQDTLRPAASGRNAYLLLVTDTAVERFRHRAFGAYPLPTQHATITAVGALVGVWGLFILGRWVCSDGV